mgnify:CR=1 FL=1
MSKVKGALHNTWSHHESMIVNLRDWVRRDIETLRTNLSKELPQLAEDPSVLKTLRTAEDLSMQLFDTIRSVVDLAEVEAKKAKKPVAAPKTEDDEELLEA